jgi:hypothetical protein
MYVDGKHLLAEKMLPSGSGQSPGPSPDGPADLAAVGSSHLPCRFQQYRLLFDF